MKRAAFAVVLIACFATLAMATHQPATIGEYSGLSQVRTDRAHANATGPRCAKVTGYYYYSGSFDSTNSNANGLANEDDLLVADTHVYQPFSVIAKGKLKHLNVTGLCVNSADPDGFGIDNPTPYEVRANAIVGSGGTLVCKGTAVSSDALTGQGTLPVWTHAVKISKCKLAGSVKTGTQYHMNVTPQCFKNKVCSSARYFEVTDDSNLDHIGPPTNRGAALWNSATFKENWVNPNTVFGGNMMQSFSAGVTGTLVK